MYYYLLYYRMEKQLSFQETICITCSNKSRAIHIIQSFDLSLPLIHLQAIARLPLTPIVLLFQPISSSPCHSWPWGPWYKPPNPIYKLGSPLFCPQSLLSSSSLNNDAYQTFCIRLRDVFIAYCKPGFLTCELGSMSLGAWEPRSLGA
jgi:hypothetical protein